MYIKHIIACAIYHFHTSNNLEKASAIGYLGYLEDNFLIISNIMTKFT